MNEDLAENKPVYLCFVNLVGQEEDGNYRYEFIFTDNPDEVWGDDFEYKPCSIVNGLMVAEEYKTETHIVKTKIQFYLIQNSGCFGMQDCMDGVVSLCFSLDEDLNQPIILNFGDTYNDVAEQLAKNNILIS